MTICGRRKDKIEEALSNLNKNVSGIIADVTKDDDRANIIETTLNHGKKN